MVTHKDFDELMDGTKFYDLRGRLGVSSKEDRLRAKQKADKNRKEVQSCLARMDQDLHMVFKVNNYLNSIYMALGNPSDNYYFIVRALVWL